MMFVVGVYDIVDNKRRNRVSRLMEDYGNRVQESVFEFDIDASCLQRLILELKGVVTGEDGVRIYRLCETCFRQVTVIGVGEITRNAEFYIV